MFKERFQEEFLFKVTNNTKKSTKNEEFSESCAKVFFVPESRSSIRSKSRVLVRFICCFYLCSTSSRDNSVFYSV